MKKYVAAGVLMVGVALPSQALATAQQQNVLEERIRTANDELFHKGNLDVAAKIFSPQYVVHMAGGQTEVGPQAIREFVTAMRTAFPDLQVKVQVLVEKDDRVAWLRTHRGTFKSDFFGAKATGKVVSWQQIIVTRYAGDLIAEEWGVSDFVEAVQKAR